MSSKCALVIFLVAIFCATCAPSQAYGYAASANKTHNLIVGSRLPGDRLVHREYVTKSSSLWQVTTLEKIFSAPKYERITQVVALDEGKNGTGAYANIVRGGPGLNNVTIRFKSQRNHGIKFQVQLYSRR